MSDAPATSASPARTRWLVAAALFLGTLALYARVGGHPFIFFDDNRYVTENPTVQAGLTWQGVKWAFTTLHVSNWHPLTWLSHMLDVELFGLNPGPHHVANVALHAANAVLVFLVFVRMTGATWRSAFVAALFAVHPTHVESVAWVAERKDVLSTLFGLLAMLAYAGWARRGGAARYLAVVALFTASLLAKPMWVTMPFLLLLLDAWPLQRWAGSPIPVDPEPRALPRHGAARLLLEKVPLLALSVASSAVTVVAQSKGGAMVNLDLGMGPRIGNAAVAYVRYVAKTFWPVDLAIYYPHPAGGLPVWQAVGAASVVLVTSAAAVIAAKRAPWLALGWFWFLGTLVPVVGLVQVGAQAMADRYTYLPTLGIYLAVSWGGWATARRFGLQKIGAVAAAASLLVISAVTWVQSGYWSDHVTLFERALAVQPRSGVAVGVLSEGMRRAGRLEEAVTLAEEAVSLAPGTVRHLNNLAISYRDLKRYAEAREVLEAAIKLDPAYATSWLNLGLVEMDLGRAPEAIAAYEGALARGAENAAAIGNLAVLYQSVGRYRDAGWAFERAAQLDPSNVAVWWNLGVFRSKEGRLPEAEAAFLEAQRRSPGNPGIRQKLEELRIRSRR
ncbi:MAG: tetratricopeptide repeat protein [Anaeromyxobacteraceae bacterium]